MATATQTRSAVVPPFGIEIDTETNCDMIIQSLPLHDRLRSAVRAGKNILDPETGKRVMLIDPARHLAMLPDVPGQQLHVNPAKLTYTITDPLCKDENLCSEICDALRADERPFMPEKLKGIKPTNGDMDKHHMKTLCREMAYLVEHGYAKMAKGPQPTQEQVDELPGSYLLDPGLKERSSRPLYEEEFDEWYEQLCKLG